MNDNWYWEGNVVTSLVQYLGVRGWTVRSVADTASRAAGVDIVAENADGHLFVEVKGYPSPVYEAGPNKGQPSRTNQASQARQWYSHALLSVLTLRNACPDAAVAIGLTEFPTYLRLMRKTAWCLETLRIQVFLVRETGEVRVWENVPGTESDYSSPKHAAQSPRGEGEPNDMNSQNGEKRSADAWYVCAEEYRVAERFEEAVAAYDQALARKMVFPDAHLGRAVALASLHKHLEALEAVRTAITQGDGNARARAIEGRLLVDLDRIPEALPILQAALQESPDQVGVLWDIGRGLLRLGRMSEAIDALKQSALLDPRFRDAKLALGLALLFSRHEALPSGGRPVEEPFLLCIASLALNEPSDAQEYHAELHELDPAAAERLVPYLEEQSELRPENEPLRQALARIHHLKDEKADNPLPAELLEVLFKALADSWLIIPTAVPMENDETVSYEFSTVSLEDGPAWVVCTDMEAARRVFPGKPVSRIVQPGPNCARLIVQMVEALGATDALGIIVNPAGPYPFLLRMPLVEALAACATHNEALETDLVGREAQPVDAESVWRRIEQHQGEIFHLVRGRSFTYRVEGDSLALSTTSVKIPRKQIETARQIVPLSSTADLNHLMAPSYLYAILTDARIRCEEDEKAVQGPIKTYTFRELIQAYIDAEAYRNSADELAAYFEGLWKVLSGLYGISFCDEDVQRHHLDRKTAYADSYLRQFRRAAKLHVVEGRGLFHGFLEMPKEMADLYRPHSRTLGRLASEKKSALFAFMCAVVEMLYDGLDATFTSEHLRRNGFDDSNPPDPWDFF